VKGRSGRNSHLSSSLELPYYSVRSDVTIWKPVKYRLRVSLVGQKSYVIF